MAQLFPFSERGRAKNEFKCVNSDRRRKLRNAGKREKSKSKEKKNRKNGKSKIQKKAPEICSRSMQDTLRRDSASNIGLSRERRLVGDHSW